MKKTLHLKRALRAALLVLLLSAAGVTNVFAQTAFTVGDLIYSVNDDGVSVTVTGHVNGSSATGVLNIPETVVYGGDAYSVTDIGIQAFRNCAGLSAVSFPNTLTVIGQGAFQGCRGLTSITLPGSLNSVGNHAFSLSNIMITNFTGTIEQWCHISWDGPASNPIYKSNNLFINGEELIDLVIPETITEIGNYCFQNCESIRSLVIPNSIDSIGVSAFFHCTNITSLNVPNSVSYVGEAAFRSCWGLNEISVEEGNPNYDSRENCNALIETHTNTLLVGCNNTFIPDHVSSIDEYSFYCLVGLTSVIIPSFVNSIGQRAFGGCSGLNSVISLATAPPTLGENAFSDISCTTLTVPCGCAPAYEATEWHDFFPTILEDCTGVVEDMSGLAIVFPNPTSGVVKIEAEHLRHISIFNELGQKVFEEQVDGDEMEINLGSQEAGVYLICMETANGIATKRVVVTK